MLFLKTPGNGIMIEKQNVGTSKSHDHWCYWGILIIKYMKGERQATTKEETMMRNTM